MSPQLNPLLGSIPVVMNSVDGPSIYTPLSIAGYVMSHMGGVGLSQRCNGLPVAVEEDEAEGVGSPSARKPMSVNSKAGLGEY